MNATCVGGIKAARRQLAAQGNGDRASRPHKVRDYTLDGGAPLASFFGSFREARRIERGIPVVVAVGWLL